jgi:hypothetical protein
LQLGENTLEANLEDRAGNIGETEWVDIDVETSDPIMLDYDASGRLERIEPAQ